MNEDTRYFTFWRRVGANLLDGLIVGVVAGILVIPVVIIVFVSSIEPGAAGEPPEVNLSDNQAATLVATILLITFGGYAYTISMLATRGQTIGKMATGIIVLDAVTGGRIGWRQAFMRSLGEIVLQATSVLLLVVGVFGEFDEEMLQALNVTQTVTSYGWWIAEVVTMLTNPRRRALHDLIAGTVVVKKSYVDQVAQPAFATPPSELGW